MPSLLDYLTKVEDTVWQCRKGSAAYADLTAHTQLLELNDGGWQFDSHPAHAFCVIWRCMLVKRTTSTKG